jgi:hypothetical protein
MKKTLHIGDSNSWEGCMKLSMYKLAPKDSFDIMAFDPDFGGFNISKGLTHLKPL